MGTKHSWSSRLSETQEAAINATVRSHRALVAAQAHLERALGSAQTGREQSWAEEVVSELRKARDLLSTHRNEVQSPQGLYRQIESEAPHFAPRIEGLIEDLTRIEEHAALLVEELRGICQGKHRHLLDIRPDAALMMTEIRRLMAMEADIVFERFEEPPALH
jgi:chromosome segregation ATPase